MSVQQSNQAKQLQIYRLGLVVGSSAFFLLAILLFRIYPSDFEYDWRKKVQIEEIIKKSNKRGLETKIQGLEKRRQEMKKMKVPENSEAYVHLIHSLSLHKSLQDYERKLSLSTNLRQQNHQFLEKRIKSIKLDILKLSEVKNK